MSRIIFDEPPWWQQPRWQLVAAAVLAFVALAIWWTALTPVDHDPIVARTPAAPAVVARTVSPAPVAPVARPAPAAVPPPANTSPAVTDVPALPVVPSPPSTMVPRITPLNLPPGLLQLPAEQPSEDNLEN